MITAAHAKKLAEVKGAIKNCKFYIKELNYISKCISKLIKRGIKTDSIIYEDPSPNEIDCLESICADYNSVGYDIRLVQLSNGNYRVSIHL